MSLKLIITIGLILMTSLSCVNFKRTDLENSKPEPKTVIEQKQSHIICSKTITHKFSNVESPDTFKIWIQGDSLLKSDVHFEIVNSAGTMIYSVEFKSYLLLNYDISSDTTDAVKETFIKTRIAEFLKEDNFKSPAIGDKETFDADYSDKSIWDEITINKNSIGFYYLIGEEDGRSIAYSNKQKKVVIYFNCC
jgi:hypothetical protein